MMRRSMMRIARGSVRKRAAADAIDHRREPGPGGQPDAEGHRLHGRGRRACLCCARASAWTRTEITDIARKIDTFETSILPYEDCCTIFTPPHPKTKPHLDEIEAAEAGMPGLAELEAQAAAQAEVVVC